ncbi:MAG: cell wall hydrolase [Lachnospiraceae bacterium]|nr:cell wall hydrolase [Lachnospiraceae bacterium]
MKKAAWPALIIALSIIIAGTWGSTVEVTAKDAGIRVVTAGAAKAATTDKSKAVASKDTINIEIVKDTDSKSSSGQITKKKGTVAGISYDKLVMADVDEAVNVRESASEDSKLVGKFFKECGGEILEKGDGWTKVKTGDLTGWIKNDFLLFGDKAVDLANKVVEKTATCETDCLRVRKSADPDATVLDLLAKGDKIGVLGQEGEWTKVEFSDGEEGYVSTEFVTIADSLGTGKTIEKIKAEEDQAKKEKADAEAAAKKAEVEAGRTTETTKTNNGAVAADVSDQVLLAALIQAEGGNQPYEGQVSIGTVVMNRLRSGRYGNSIYSVIYAKSQFGPAGSGQVAKIAAAGPKASCLQAAQDALNGVSYIGGATHFRNIRSGYTGIVIGSHVFW